MAEETTQATQDSASTPDVPESTDTPIASGSEALKAPAEVKPEPAAAMATAEVPIEPEVAATSSETVQPKEPDALQPFIDKAFETIQHEADSVELDKFLRAHIKTFREEWDVWTDKTKDAYVHMMASQFVQRKAAAIQISLGNEFKLPVPSAQTTLFESIKQTQVKPQKRQPVLLMPPNLRPTYSLKK
jgi:hypothetical protein